MTKSQMFFLFAALALNTACRKNEDGSSRIGGTLPGSCGYALSDYHGTVTPMILGAGQTQRQTIAIRANVVDRPEDRVYVTLCRVADCDTTIPALSCTQVSDFTTPCKRTIPIPNIGLGRGEVYLINAGTGPNGGQYSAYFVHEEVCM
jgi:hypothetical protein